MYHFLLLSCLLYININELSAVQSNDAEGPFVNSNKSSGLTTASHVNDYYYTRKKRDIPTEPSLVTTEPSVFTDIYWAITTDAHAKPSYSSQAIHEPDHSKHPSDYSKSNSMDESYQPTSTTMKELTLTVRPLPKVKSQHHDGPKGGDGHPAHTSTMVETSAIVVKPLPKTARG